jgi:hypothetical protein
MAASATPQRFAPAAYSTGWSLTAINPTWTPAIGITAAWRAAFGPNPAPAVAMPADRSRASVSSSASSPKSSA